MPFLRRTALARSRCFSASQRDRVSGVFPIPPCLPNARNPLLSKRFSGTAAGCRCLSGAAPAGLRSSPRHTTHPAALTQFGLNGRHAHHQVRPPLLHSRLGPSPQSGDSAAASAGERPGSSCHVAWSPAGRRSRGRGRRRMPAGLLGSHRQATPRPVAHQPQLGRQVVLS